MTTKELINQYVTAHADNRWMDASELEALLTEFAEQMIKDAVEVEVFDDWQYGKDADRISYVAQN